MSKLDYTPDADVKVHEEGAIKLICKAFQSHENGLPEWLKNSADAYAREDKAEAMRVIVVLFDSGRRGRPSSISCLDMCGMTSSKLEQNFRIWADPEAASRGAREAQVQGGHGNGGKCYMTQMFERHALLHTAKEGKGSKYGVPGGSVRFGYIPDPARGRDFPVADIVKELDRLLVEIGCSVGALPRVAQDALSLADGFTLVTGVGPKGYEKKFPIPHLVSNLEEHSQMIRTLEICKIFVVVNGKPYNQGKPLALPEIEPMEGAEQPRIIPVPEVLRDPDSEQSVPTTKDGKLPTGTLVLHTSKVSMRWSKKGRHNVIYKAESGYIGYITVTALDIQSSYRDRIYGECTLESLEPFKQNERGQLASSPLTRAANHFISEEIQKYAKEFEARDRRQHDQEERNALSKINESLDRWKNKFLNELLHGLWGHGPGEDSPPRLLLSSGKAARIELALSHQKAGIGVAFRPILKFFDASGKHIRAVPYRWVSEDTNVAMVDEDLLIINTFSYGQTIIYAETMDNKLQSNKVPLEVVRIRDIRINPPLLEVEVGSRAKLEAICSLADGVETNDLYLVWTEGNDNVAKVSSAGLVFGFAPGETDVTCGDDKYEAKERAKIKVIPGTGRGKGEHRGRGYPLVLISSIDPDPETKEHVHLSSEDPPVYQGPQDFDRNIWWINSSAPLAKLYLDTSKDYGYHSREWRMYHTERYIEVISQITLLHGPGEVPLLSVAEWLLQWGGKVAEIQAAAAADLSEFIASGAPPQI